MASFADVQYYIYADIVGMWVQKSPKKYMDGPLQKAACQTQSNYGLN